MTLDLQTGREMVRQCALQCSASEIEWFHSTDIVLLDTGGYVSDSCMRSCVDVAVQVFNSAAEVGTACTKVAMDSGKQVFEISAKEVGSSIIFGLMVTIGVATIGAYYLYRRNWICLSVKT